jgi:hypothetical protein
MVSRQPSRNEMSRGWQKRKEFSSNPFSAEAKAPLPVCHLATVGMFRGERPASGDLQEGVPFVPQSELGRAATSETTAKCEGERKQVGNQREPSIGGFRNGGAASHASTRDRLPFALAMSMYNNSSSSSGSLSLLSLCNLRFALLLVKKTLNPSLASDLPRPQGVSLKHIGRPTTVVIYYASFVGCSYATRRGACWEIGAYHKMSTTANHYQYYFALIRFLQTESRSGIEVLAACCMRAQLLDPTCTHDTVHWQALVRCAACASHFSPLTELVRARFTLLLGRQTLHTRHSGRRHRLYV